MGNYGVLVSAQYLCHSIIMLFLCSTVGPLQATVPHTLTAPVMHSPMGCSCCHTTHTCVGSCVWAAASFRSYPPAAAWAPPHGMQCECLLWCDPIHKLQGNLCWSGTFYPFLGNFGVCRVVSYHFFFSFSQPLCCIFYLNYIVSDAPPSLLWGSALFYGEAIGGGWKHLCPAWRSLWHLLTSPKACRVSLIQYCNSKSLLRQDSLIGFFSGEQ